MLDIFSKKTIPKFNNEFSLYKLNNFFLYGHDKTTETL